MASNKSGVFTLGDVGERQETGSWDTASDVWMIGSPVTVGKSPFGYVVTGSNPDYNTQISTIQRIDYNNDTQNTLTRSSITTNRWKVAGVSSLTHGYVVGGRNTFVSPIVNISSIERLDYGNDTETPLIRGPLSTASCQQAGAGNRSFGYIMGGGDPAK